MNKQLRELMLKAGYADPEIALKAQNLAESIVRECAKLANNLSQHEGPGDGDIAEYIKEHFGVGSKIENIMAGAEIHSGGGYTESTWERYNEFVKKRNRNEPTR